jgi:hypothetical protein
MNTVAKRNVTQTAVLDDLEAEASDLYDKGDILGGDRLLFSREALAALTWHDPLERARRQWNANADELEWC